MERHQTPWPALRFTAPRITGTVVNAACFFLSVPTGFEPVPPSFTRRLRPLIVMTSDKAWLSTKHEASEVIEMPLLPPGITLIALA